MTVVTSTELEIIRANIPTNINSVPPLAPGIGINALANIINEEKEITDNNVTYFKSMSNT